MKGLTFQICDFVQDHIDKFHPVLKSFYKAVNHGAVYIFPSPYIGIFKSDLLGSTLFQPESAHLCCLINRSFWLEFRVISRLSK